MTELTGSFYFYFFFPSRSRSGEPSGSAMEMLMRQQQMIQQHYQQLLIQQDGSSDPGSSSSSSSSSYLSSASPWLLGLFGYTQMLQSFQAAQQQQIATDPATGSGQVCIQYCNNGIFFLYRIFMKMWLMVDRFRLVRARRLLRHPSADRTAKAKWRKKIWMLADSLTVRSARREPWLANTSGWARGPARPRCTPWGSKYRSASVWNSSRNPSRPHPPSHPPLQPRKTDRNSKVEPNDLPVEKNGLIQGVCFLILNKKKSNFHAAFAESLPDQKWPIFLIISGIHSPPFFYFLFSTRFKWRNPVIPAQAIHTWKKDKKKMLNEPIKKNLPNFCLSFSLELFKRHWNGRSSDENNWNCTFFGKIDSGCRKQVFFFIFKIPPISHSIPISFFSAYFSLIIL